MAIDFYPAFTVLQFQNMNTFSSQVLIHTIVIISAAFKFIPLFSCLVDCVLLILGGWEMCYKIGGGQMLSQF